jgi:multicomponent Na+:H+ antiporter subunit A
MTVAVLAGFIFALLMPLLGRVSLGRFAAINAILPLSLFIWFASFLFTGLEGGVNTHIEWAFGAGLSFKLDGLSLIFALLITGIGALVFAYSASYMKGNPYLDRFYAYLSTFMAAMLGVVLAANALTLFIFWELTSISSFFLIGFKNKDEASRKSALIALAVTGFGGFALLAAMLLMGAVSGTYSIEAMLLQPEVFASSPYITLILVLIFFAAFTKSAQFPFHFWLPGAMKAPTPVSTYLHSATMVKAGIYLLFRFSPAFADFDLWRNTLMIAGGITMLYGAVHSLFRTDLKSILAYTTISALGTLTFLIGIGTRESIIAALVFVVVHALYKAAMFLVAGIIDHQTHTRDVTLLAGLGKAMPLVAAASLVAALSGAGIPITFGFIGKDLIYEATLHQGDWSTWLTIIALLTNIMVGIAGFIAAIKPFAGRLPDALQSTKSPGFALWFAPVLLAVLSLVLGVSPGFLDHSLLIPALSALQFDTQGVYLKMWHGINTVFWLSMVTIAGSVIIYLIAKPFKYFSGIPARLDMLAPQSLVLGSAQGFTQITTMWNRAFQSGYLRYYILISVTTVFALAAAVHLPGFHWRLDMSMISSVTVYEWVLVFIMVGGVFFTVFTNSRLAAVASMGVIGYAMCLIFVIYGAPDLAMTQFTIDTLTVILFVLVLYKLPKYLKLTRTRSKIRDGVVSIVFGTLMTAVVLDVLSLSRPVYVSSYYADNAYLLAKGKNIVNVILVDFRGIDTFMEIVVLAVSAVGVYGLLKLKVTRHEE